jgi:phage terminase small subunit
MDRPQISAPAWPLRQNALPRFETVVFGRNVGFMDLREPPSHLSPSAAQWWRTTVETYVLGEHHLRLLQLCCEAWDEVQKAREQLDREGFTVPVGRHGGVRSHPCVTIERDARLAVARLVRELDLDTEPPVSGRIGPPAIFSNRGQYARKASRS